MAPPLEAEKNRSDSDIRQAIFSRCHDDEIDASSAGPITVDGRQPRFV
jgi:hypothetical protein